MLGDEHLLDDLGGLEHRRLGNHPSLRRPQHPDKGSLVFPRSYRWRADQDHSAATPHQLLGGRVMAVDLGRRYLLHSCVWRSVWCSASASTGEIGSRRRSWRSESYRQARLLIATLLFSSRSGAPDFGGIAKLAEAIQKLTPSGQLLIGAVVFGGNRGCTRRRRFSHGTLTLPRESFACGPYAVGHRGRRPIQASTTFNGFAPFGYPNCGQDAAKIETGPRASSNRCAQLPAHKRRHAAGDSHSARPGPFLRNVRRSIRTCLADHHLVGRQRDDGP